MAPQRDHRAARFRGTRTHPRPPWWKRKPHWLVAAVVPTVVAGLLLTWVVWLAGPRSESVGIPAAVSPHSGNAGHSGPNGAPVLINVIHEGEQSQPVNGAFAFAQALNLSKSDLARIDRSGITSWAARRGGFDIGRTLIKLTVTAQQDVRVVGMQAIILSIVRPPNGTFFGIAGQGFVPNTAVDISLPSSSPTALAVGPDGLPSGTPYFDKYSYDLSRGQSATFEITAYPTLELYSPQQGDAIRWDLQISLLTDGHVENLTVKGAGGVPFATTGSVAGNGRSFTAAYQAVYEQCLYQDNPVTQCKNVLDDQWVRIK